MSQPRTPWCTEAKLELAAIIFCPIMIIFVLTTLIIADNARNERLKVQMVKEQLKKDHYITVDELGCRPILKSHSKRQLSELTELEKWVAKDATECGSVFQNVRLLKSRIRSYSPHFSLFMWRDHRDDNDPGAPVHITEYNVENCELALASPEQEVPSRIVVNRKCSELDEVLK